MVDTGSKLQDDMVNSPMRHLVGNLMKAAADKIPCYDTTDIYMAHGNDSG